MAKKQPPRNARQKSVESIKHKDKRRFGAGSVPDLP